MKLDKEENRSILKLAQFRKLLEKKNVNKKEVELIIQGIDLNFKVPSTNFLEEYDSRVIGNTLLHLAYEKKKVNVFNFLICKGADFNGKDKTGYTVLHKSFRDVIHRSHCTTRSNEERLINSINLAHAFASVALTAHVRYRNTLNSSDPDGFTHFHIACAENSIETVELFLSDGVPVNQTTNSKLFAGYTPLHFAVQGACFNVAKILLKHGANVNLMNAKGQTPLHIFVERSIAGSYLQFAVKQVEEMMNLLLTHYEGTEFSHLHVVCSMQKSFQAENLLNQQIDVNQCISMNSLNWPGYTALHFAAQTHVDTVKLLIKHGANIDARNAIGFTPMDMCFIKYKAEDIFDILCLVPSWKNIVLSDGKTKLVDLIFAFKDLVGIRNFLQKSDENIKLFVPFDSPLLPGFTVLHIAVLLSEKVRCTSDCRIHEENQLFQSDLSIIRECLKQGANVTVKNLGNMTPIHMAFLSGYENILNLLLQYHHTMINPVDNANLSHLHIACAARNHDLIEKFLWNKIDVNIVYRGNLSISSVTPGSAPLHIAVSNRSCETVKLLLKFGADPLATDCRFYTAIDRLVDDYFSYELSKVLFSSINFSDCIAKNMGLNYLHVACCTRNVDAVKKLLDFGVEVNKALTYVKMENQNNRTEFGTSFSKTGNAPLHTTLIHSRSITEEQLEIVSLLIERGADILMKNSFDISPLRLMLILPFQDLHETVMSVLKSNHSLKKRVESETGLTMLHLACHKHDFDLMKELLDSGSNVNAQIHKDSSIWPGFTPLHVLLHRLKFSAAEHENTKLIKLLLNHRADVTLTNDKRRTPLHMMYHKLNRYSCSATRALVSLLLKAQENFEINPTNTEGVSHFHIACNVLDIDAVKKFLEHDVDVNAKIDVFHNSKFAACTPLLLVTQKTPENPTESVAQLKIVDLLIKYGANVNAADILGNTPVHFAASANSSSTRDNLLQRLANSGADVNARNLQGKAPLELLMKTDKLTHQDLRHFIACGCIFNAFNLITEVGYIAQALSMLVDGQMQCLLSGTFINFPNMVKTDDLNRTAIHNIVSFSNLEEETEDFVDCFDTLKTFGCDIDDYDSSGRTPLHLAAVFRSYSGIEALLLTGADINIIDKNSKVPFAYLLEPCSPYHCSSATMRLHNQYEHDYLIGFFVNHIKKLQLFNLDVRQSNENLLNEALDRFEDIVNDQSLFLLQAEQLMKLKIEPYSLTVADFMSDTGAIVDYPTMSLAKRTAINEFFQMNKSHVQTKFEEAACLFQLQYRKALKRYKIIDMSLEALTVLTDFHLPPLCSHIILKFLKNSDLENLIAAAFHGRKTTMEVD